MIKNPHYGYDIISSLQKKHNNVNILTQNIDGLHRKCRHLNVIELHGSSGIYVVKKPEIFSRTVKNGNIKGESVDVQNI